MAAIILGRRLKNIKNIFFETYLWEGGEIIIFYTFNVLTKEGRMIGSNQSPIVEACLKAFFTFLLKPEVTKPLE